MSDRQHGGGGGGRRDGRDRGGGGGYQGGGGGYHGGGGGGGGGGHRGGGGGYDRGGRGDQGNRHQRSFVGQKRGREEEPAEDPKRTLVSKLMTLCDKPAAGDRGGERGGDDRGSASDAAAIEDAYKLCKRELQHKNESVLELLVDCATELGSKAHTYALIAGLLNADEPAWGAALLSRVVSDLSAALKSEAPADHDRARLLLRFAACLAAANVTHPSGVVGLLQALVDAAVAAARSGDAGGGHTWQPWADWSVYAALAALPWAGAELGAACPAEMSALGEGVEAYLMARPISRDDDLAPFSGPISATDTAATSDSGGASFLPELWDALAECQAGGWACASVGPHHTDSPQWMSRLAVATPHALPFVDVPTTPPLASVSEGAAPGLLAARVRRAYPPRGGIRLLDRALTEGGQPGVERFVAEEIILDTLAAFDVNRVQCVKRLAGLQLPYAHVPLLCETLMAQMLALPTPRLPVMSYCTIIVDLCKLSSLDFPKPLSGCVREAFARLGVMDPELRARLVAWLSYHLSNFGFFWPWHRWEVYVDEPVTSPHRQFCQELVTRLCRLSFWERVAAVLPAKFRTLLGPPPSTPVLPGHEPAPGPGPKPDAGLRAAHGVDREEGGAGPGAEGAEGTNGGEAAMETDGAGAGEGAGSDGAPAEGEGMAAEVDGGEGARDVVAAPREVSVEDGLSGRLLSELRGKASCDAVLQWVEDNGVEVAVGAGPEVPLKVVMRAVLAAGAKSPSHLHVALERYAAALAPLLEAVGREAGEPLLVGLAADFYAQLPQKVLMVVDRLMALGLVGAGGVATWALGTAIPSTLGAPASASSAWEVLHYALARTMARAPQAAAAAAKLREEEAVVRAKAKALLDQAAKHDTELQALLARGKAEGEGGGGAGGEGEGKDGGPTPETRDPQEGRSRKLLAAQRDAEHRAGQLTAKADALQSQAEAKGVEAEAAAAAPGAALITVIRGLLRLLAEEEAALAQGAGEDTPMDAPEGEGAGPLTSEVRALRIGELYAQLRALARRYAAEVAEVMGQLEAGEVRGPGAPSKAAEVLSQVLHTTL